MRARPLLLIAAVVGAAAAATAIVTTQLPREGQVSRDSASIAAPGIAPGATSPPVEPAATARDGTLEIRVTAGGEPLAGADVRVYSAPLRAGTREEGRWLLAGEARSDAAAIAHVPARPGTYLVCARAPGLAPGRSEAIRAEGEEVSRAEVALEAPVALAGRISASSQAGGQAGPVRARVRAFQIVSRWPMLAPPSAPPEEIAVAEADAAGAFQLEGLAPGTYAVSVEAADLHPVLVPRLSVPSDPLAIRLEALGTVNGVAHLDDGRPASGAVVRAWSAEHAAQTTAGADGRFTLRAPAGSYGISAALGDRAGAAPGPVAVAAGVTSPRIDVRLGPAAAIEGEVVLAASGRPVPHAEVAVAPHGALGVAARAAAGGDGRFRIQGLAPGAFDVRVSAPGATPASLGGVTLAAGAHHSLRVPLAGTGAIEGYVRDPGGLPLASIRVRVVQRGEGLAAAPLEARTDFDGRFAFDAVEVGRAEVVARDEPVLAGVSHAVRVAEGRTSRVDLVLPEAGVLTGIVARERGLPPPAGTTVVAVPMKAGLGTMQVARSAADAHGNYQLTLPAGDYRVHAAPADADRADLRVAPSFAHVQGGRTSRLDLLAAAPPPEGGAAVLVLEPGGAPSPGAVVTIARAGDARIALATTAGEDGRVVIPADMGMAGRGATIRARNGGRTGEATAELPASGTVTVVLAPGGAVEGVVRGLGRERSGFTLEVASQPAADGWRTVDVHRFTGDRFALADVPAESLRLTVRTDDGRRGETEVRVARGETRSVTIALAKR